MATDKQVSAENSKDSESGEYQDFGAAVLQESGEDEVVDAAPAVAELGADRTAAAMLRVAESMEKIVQRQEAVRQVPYSEVLPVSAFNPEGKRDHPKFARPTYLQGILLNSLQHFPEEVRLFNQIKPGRYLDRKVEVRRGNDGSVDLQWPGVRIDQRIDFYSRYPTLAALLKAVIQERAAKEQKRLRGQVDEDEAL